MFTLRELEAYTGQTNIQTGKTHNVAY